jgi:hypothetical protein
MDSNLEKLLFEGYVKLRNKLTGIRARASESSGRVKEEVGETKEKLMTRKEAIKAASSYIRLMYFSKPFMATYLPSRIFYSSLWMLAPVAAYRFQQLQLDPFRIQMVSTVAMATSAVYGPINGIVTDKLKGKSYLTTTLDRIISYATVAGRIITTDPYVYTHLAAISGLSGGELDWANKYGMTVNRGQLMSTIKQIFRVINLGLSTAMGFVGAGIYTAWGLEPLITVTSLLATVGIVGYVVGARKYKDYWEEKTREGVQRA